MSPLTRSSGKHTILSLYEYINGYLSMIYGWPPIRSIRYARKQEATMELIFTTIAVIGGMTLSLTVALLVEELIFGKVLGPIFADRTHQAKAVVQR